MPVYTYQGKKWNIPEDKVEKFLHDIPGANLYEDPKEAKLNQVRIGALGGNKQDDYLPNPYTENFLSDEERVANEEYSRTKTNTSFDNIQPGVSMQQKPAGFLDLPQSESIKDVNKDIFEYQKANRSFQDGIKRQVLDLGEDIEGKIKDTYQIESQEKRNNDNEVNPFIRAFSNARSGKNIPLPYEGTPRTANYAVAQDYVNKTNDLIREYEKKDDSKLAGAARGARDKAFNIDAWSFGVSELDKNNRLSNVVDKYEKGQELSDDEQKLLDSLAVNLAANQYFSEGNRGYKWGAVAGESVPFMVEFMLNPIAGSGKGIAKKIAEYGIKRFAAQGASKTAIKAGSRVVGDVIGAAGMAATTGAPRTIADALNRNLGQATFDLDENEKIIYAGHKGGDDAVTSAFKAVGANLLEYQSEMLGSSGLGTLVGKVIPKGMTKAIKASDFGRFAGRMKNSSLYRETKALMQRGQWNGTVGEYGEEVYNQIANSLFIGDNKLSDLTNIDEQVDIFMGLALTGGVMGTVNTGAYVIDRTRTANQLRQADSDAAQYIANWDGIKEQLQNLPIEERSQTIKDVLKRNDLTIPAKKAFADYTRTLTYRDALLGAADQKLEDDRAEAEQNGRELAIDDKRRSLLSTLNREKIELESKLGDIAKVPEDKFGEYIETVSLTDEQINDWNTYNQRRNEYNGLVKQLREEVDKEIEPAIQDIKRVTRPDGQIIYADFGSEGTLPVVNGNISINEDGTIDRQNTDNSLTVLMPDGKKRIISSKFISGNPIMNTPAELEEEARQNAYDIFVSPIEEAINGTERFTEGTPVEYIDEKGQAQAGTIVSTQGNTVTVLPNDGNKSKIRTLTHDQLRNSLVKESLGDIQVRDEFSIDIPDGYKNIRPGQYNVQVEEIKDGTATLRFVAPGETDQYIPEATIDDINAIMPAATPVVEPEIPESVSPTVEQNNTQDQQNIPDSEIQPESDLSTDAEPQVETAVSFIDRIPKGEKGALIFEHAPIETTVGALGEVYEDQEELTEVVKATITSIQKQIEKAKIPKPTGDINKDITNKQAAKQQLIDLNNRLEYWNSVQTEITPVKSSYESRMEAIEMGNTRKRESSMGEYLSLRDYLLRNIATGKFKFLWNSSEGKKGLKDEILASKNTEPERRKRIAFLNNKGGYTPESLAEELFENAGQGSEINPGWFSDAQDIRNEIIDILLSNDTPTSMVDAATELRRQPESIEEYYENFADPQIIEQYDSAEAEEVISTAQLPFEAMSDEELGSYFDELEDNINFEEKNDGLEGTRTGTYRQDVAGDIESDNTGGESGDSPAEETQGENNSRIPEEAGITEGGSSPYSFEQPDQERAGNEYDRHADTSERSIDEINVGSDKNTNFVDNQDYERKLEDLYGGNEAIGRTIEEAGNSTGSDRAATQAGQSGGTKERLLGELRSSAEKFGAWIEKPIILVSKPIGKGQEHEVYLSKDGESVIKLNNLDFLPGNATNLNDFLNRAVTQNTLFPQDNFTILGLALNSKGQISVVISQPYVQSQREATDAEIDSFLEEHGFTVDMRDVWTDGRFEITDLKTSNVLIDINGRMRFIDVVAKDVTLFNQNKNTVSPKFTGDLPQYLREIVKNQELQKEAEKVDPNPSEAQKEAGNYKKGHVNVQGFDITIENPRGSVRSGTDKSGKNWSIEMQNHYGYFKRTEGKDGDHIDVFVGINPESGKVFVVDQVNTDKDFDESKVMLGFNSIDEAREAYLSNYEEGWQGLGDITETSVNDFKKWLYDGAKQRKAFSEHKSNKEKILDVNGNPILSADEWNSLSKEEQEPLKDTITKSVTDLDGNTFNVDHNIADPLQRIITAGYATGQSDSGTTTDHPGYRYIEDHKQGKYKKGDLIRGGAYLTFWRPEALLIQEAGRRINTQEKIDAIINAVNKTGFVYDFTDVFFQPSIRVSLRQANDGTKEQALLKEANALTDEAYPGLHDNNFFEWLEYRNETYLPIVEQKHGGMKEWTDNEIINKWNELANELEKESNMGIPISDNMTESYYGSSNTLISSDQYEELRKRMRDKLNSLNMGFDPELFTIGTQMAMYHIEAGARKFKDFAKRMIEDLGDSVTPYLKSFYESARHMPGMESIAPQMDSPSSVKSADVNNLDTKKEKKAEKKADISKQLSIFEEDINNNDHARVLQTNSNRLPKGESSEILQRTQGSERTGRNSDQQSGELSRPDGTQQQSTDGQRSILSGNADVLIDEQPALVEFNAQSNDTESFNKSKKYADNISAIETLLTILKENRKATPEEKTILSKYVGFGGLKEILQDPDNNSAWKDGKYRDQVRKIIELSKEFDGLTNSDDTLNKIRGSILNAHFTPDTVINAIYKGLNKLGFKSGRILEPSAGIGNFITYMPESIKGKSNISAVELDKLTGNILKAIHDNTYVQISGIENANIPDNSQDLVISNVPFGNYKVYDRAFKGDKEQFLNRIHNYFFAKALDKVREGGIIAFVTSKGVLDSPGNENLREYLNKNADFLGAVRLPNSTFLNTANTQVVTDIIFLKKNSNPSNTNFVNVAEVEAKHKDGEIEKVTVNQYFIDNPQNMLGEIEAGGMYDRSDYTLKDNGSLKDLVNVIKEALPANIYTKGSSAMGLNANDLTGKFENVKEGNVFLSEGKLYRKEEGIPAEVKLNEPVEKIQRYISLRDALMELIYYEYANLDPETVKANRKKLNDEYDKFVNEYGKLEKSIIKISKIDSDGYNVLSLENKGQKADIFTKRTINPVSTKTSAESIDEAIVISLSETAGVDMERIGQLMGMDMDEVKASSKGKIFERPEGGYVTRDEYLSGNVKRKLAEAKQAVESGFTEFQNNVDELERVIPADIPAIQIESRLGSRWIPASIYTDFARHLLKDNQISISYSHGVDQYFSSDSRLATVEATQKFGTSKVNGVDILLSALHINPPKVYDYWKDEFGKQHRELNKEETDKAVQKYQEVRDLFEDWVYKSPERRELLSKIYNEKFNTTVKRKYDGSHLNIPGINGVTLRPHQKDAIWMLLQNNGGVIDHLVGAGKTYVMVAGTMEMKRTGIAKKPMIIALKSTIPQIVETYRSAYPMAKILAPMEKDFEKENRKKLFSKIANNEWDVIIMSHENYGKIPHEIDIQEKLINQELEELEAERVEFDKNNDRAALKGLEIRIKNLNARLEKLSDISKDNSLTFEQMGIDHIMTDESQQFKNLSYITKQRGIAGLGNAEGSKRSFNLLVGIRYLQDKLNGDKGTTFLSGTPITNSIVEMYSLLNYLRPNKMAELGFTSFDAWATTFANPTTDIEFTVTGNFKQKTRFREFMNVPELSMLYTEIADIRTDENLKLDKPHMKGNGYTVVEVEMNDDQKEFAEKLMKFAETKDGKLIGRGPLSDNEKSAAMLLATNLSSKMAIDMRLINPTYPYDPNGKISKLVNNVVDYYNKTEDHKGTQLIFSDLGTPKNTGNKSALLRDYLEDEVGLNIDSLNQIFGDVMADNYRYPSITTVRDKMIDVIELTNEEADQLIADSENSASKFDVYNEIKNRLIERGVPEGQIVFIHDYNTARKKEDLFNKVNEGKIRIVLGSTQKLGTGVNVQKRVVAVHHIDVPWTPASMEQRNGRALRQGNIVAKEYMNNELPVFAYATERTLDAYKYQLLQTKQTFLNQVKSGEVTERVIKEGEGDSESGVGYAELVAMLSGNQDILQKSRLEEKLNRLKRAKRNFEGELYEAIEQKRRIEGRIPEIEENIKKSEQNVRQVTNKAKFDEAGKLVINSFNGEQLKPKKEKDKEIPVERTDYAKAAIEYVENRMKKMQFGELDRFNIGGFDIEFYIVPAAEGGLFSTAKKANASLVTPNGVKYAINVSPIPGVFLNNIQKAITDQIPNALKSQQNLLQREKSALSSYSEIINRGNAWPKQDEMDTVSKELREVTERLNGETKSNENKISDGETENTVLYRSKAHRSKEAYALREWNRAKEAVNEIAKRLGVDLDLLETTDGLSEKKSRAKGWYDPKTKKITIVMPNHKNSWDVQATLLHEAVGHHGLRELFGEHFDTFLDNVYENSTESIRSAIRDIMKENNLSQRAATEEYLSYLAEDRNLLDRDGVMSWIGQVKQFFIDMLAKVGINLDVYLTVNELKYILWRSFKNLEDPGRFRSIENTARDREMQSELKVGEFAETEAPVGAVAENKDMIFEEDQGINSGNFTVVGESEAERLKRADTLFDNADNLKEAVNYPKFLTDVLNGPAKEKLLSEAREKGYTNLNKIIENYLSEVEDPEELKRIKELLGAEMPDNALKYLLWRNANPNDGSPKWKAMDAVKSHSLNDNILFRQGKVSDSAITEYERRIRSRHNRGFKSLMTGIEEGWFDRMNSLKILQDAIMKGKDMPDRMNAYLLENQLSSKNTSEIRTFNKLFIDPMIEAAQKIFGRDIATLDNYLNAKHGLERNEYMARQQVEAEKENMLAKLRQKEENMELTKEKYEKEKQRIDEHTEKRYKYLLNNRDYSGLTAIAEERDQNETFTEAAEAIVKEVEDNYPQEDIKALWEAINKANAWMLRKQYDSGMMTKEIYEKVSSMYQYYVPLRGFAETTAEEVYEYLENETSDFNKVLRKAHGRTSKAESPFANMISMGESGIMQANRNSMRQALYRLVATNPSNLATINDVWYVESGNEWIEKFPEIPENADGDQITEIIQNFNEEMTALESQDKAVRGKNKLNLKMRIGKGQASEHAVRVWIGGEEKIIYINGNPRAAQAINGLTNSSLQERSNTRKQIEFWGRQMAANFTSRNPAFMVTNFMRDIQFALVSAAIKEGGMYSFQLAANAVKVPKTIAMNVFGRGGGQFDKYWQEFTLNGGETGYANLNSIDHHRKYVNKKLREFSGQRDLILPFRAYVSFMENSNRLVEDISRFATYVTSRQNGRSIERSVSDAKEITINFNRKGSGKFGASLIHSFYLFSNPALQGLRLIGMLAKNNPVRFTAAMSSTLAMGYFAPILNEILLGLFGNDDDKEKYWNLSDWTRRNNLVLYAPWTKDKFLTFTLSHELRPFYGMGEIIHSYQKGNMITKNPMQEIAKQFTAILPIDPFAGQNWRVPSAILPVWESYISNTNFTGAPVYKDTPWNKLDPEWTKAYKSTPEPLIEGAKWLNEVSGGDDVVKGKIDINPARIAHVFRGYMGGFLTTYTDLANVSFNLITGNELSINDIPVANKLIRTSDDRTESTRINQEYYYYLDWINDYEHRQRGYKGKTREDREYIKKYINLIRSDEKKTYMKAKRQINHINKIREHNPQAAEAAKKKFVEEMREINN